MDSVSISKIFFLCIVAIFHNPETGTMYKFKIHLITWFYRPKISAICALASANNCWSAYLTIYITALDLEGHFNRLLNVPFPCQKKASPLFFLRMIHTRIYNANNTRSKFGPICIQPQIPMYKNETNGRIVRFLNVNETIKKNGCHQYKISVNVREFRFGIYSMKHLNNDKKKWFIGCYDKWPQSCTNIDTRELLRKNLLGRYKIYGLTFIYLGKLEQLAP